MASNISRHITHIKSKVVENNKPKLPNSSDIYEGEIAVNYAKGYETLSIKNESGTVVTFSSDNYYKKKEDTIASALNYINDTKLDVSAYTQYSEGRAIDITNDAISLDLPISAGTGNNSIIEGFGTMASGDSSHAEGFRTSASSDSSHAEGSYTTASGEYSHAEGNLTTASGYASHAEGYSTEANGYASHAEGYITRANGNFSHVEGNDTMASGDYSHSEGRGTAASGYASHTEGVNTIAKNESEHASGRYNASYSASTVFGNSGNTLFSVGNGTGGNARHNAFEIRQNGDIYIVNKDGNDVRLQDEIVHITVDQVINSGTSASTNAVSTNAVMTVIIENEEVSSSAINDLNNRKADTSAVTSAISDAISTISIASSAVTTMAGYAMATSGTAITTADTLNQAIGKIEKKVEEKEETIAAALVNLNDRVYDNYTYSQTKLDTSTFDTIVGSGYSNATITDVIDNMDNAVAAALNDLNDKKLDATAYTPADLSNYYTKSETNSALLNKQDASGMTAYTTTSTTTALNGVVTAHTANTDIHVTTTDKTTWNTVTSKVDTSTFNTHTASTVHMTTTEKTNLDSLATNIGAISGITSAKVTSWDNAVSDVADLSGQSETVAAALNVLNDAVNTLNDDVAELSDAVDNLVSVTYSELVGLKSTSTLVPGTLYRITDYQCTTTQDNTSAATHNFDIIVTATDVNVLNENAKAIKHDGDTYFSASTLDAWELKYSLENDTDRFQWADDTNGKGVIWWMKDEWNNECWYDFKNIMFKRYKIDDSTIDDLIGLYSIDGATNITADTSTTYYCYTFTMIDTSNNMPHDVSVEQDVYYSDEGYCYKTKSNIFKPYYDANYDLDPIPYLMILPNNVFVTDTDICSIEGTYGEFYGFYDNTFGNSCRYNTFGNYCYYNTFGNNNYNNTFGNSCGSNTFGNNNYENTFGNECYYNTFGNSCYRNTFGNYFQYNTFGNNCGINTFGNSCGSNTFGNGCGSNTFGNYCYYNTFGNECGGNTFGNSCYSNTFGNSCNNIIFQKDYIYYCIIENGNQYINITSTQTTSSSNKLQNFTVSQGVNNSTTVKTISHNTVNDTFKTTYQNSSSTVVNV